MVVGVFLTYLRHIRKYGAVSKCFIPLCLVKLFKDSLTRPKILSITAVSF
uniref:Uncharacterized protein n=1 Tax=Anguilla anguilla TaxID=7936 RepID=A0A0E9X4P3_ANGAN